MDAAILTEGLTCSFLGGAVQALRGVDLRVKAGEFVFLTGPSGGGKSALARCLTGLVPRVFPGEVAGRVRVHGRDVRELAGWEVGGLVGMVFQRPEAQLFAQRVEEEVAFGPENLGLPRAEIAERVTWALSVGGLTALRGRPTAQLSHGEQQRVALASMLALRPRVLVLDEPTSSLDEPSARRVLDAVAALRREAGTTVLAIDHRTRHYARLADRLVVLRGGKVVFDGAVSRLADGGFCRSHGLRQAGGGATASAGLGDGGPAVACARGLGFAYERGRAVLRDVTFDVPCGSAVVVSGTNGSGKSTLLKLFAGLLRPDVGSVRLHGRTPRLRLWGRGARASAYVGAQAVYHLAARTVLDEVRDGDGACDAAGLLEELGLACLGERHPLSLSEGETRRLAVGAAVARGRTLLLLDEPTIGLGGGELDCVTRLLGRHVARGGAVLAATNDPDFLCALPGAELRLDDATTWMACRDPAASGSATSP